VGERQFGPYRLVRQIAVGGMAEIHLAKTKGIAGFEKFVALKMIHPNFAEDEAFIQMLVDEAKIAVQLTHGNIAQTFDLGRVGETFYITMEYVDGADLYKILRRGSEDEKDMPLDVAAFIAKEVASALDHAHRKRDHAGKPLHIVHRDVSPQNVLVSYSGEVKLVDFGIAKAASKVKQTAAGVIKGKYYYMSPEQAWGEPIDFRSDIFSAGIVLYEMITGQMLYLEEDLHRLLDMARRADIAPPSRLRRGVPPQLEKIVMHALQKNPGDRYQSAGDFASDLERFLHAYAPVFTSSKVAGMIKDVLGDPMHVASDSDFNDVSVHDGPNATFTLDTKDLVQERDELRDENSVIFRVDDLNKKGAKPLNAAPSKPAARQPAARAPGNMTRATAPTEPPPNVGPGASPRPPAGNVGAPMSIPKISSPAAKKPAQTRKLHEETRELAFSAPPQTNSSIISSAPRISAPSWSDPADDLDGGGEHTMISAPPGGGGFMFDSNDGDGDGIDSTMVSAMPQPADVDDEDSVDEDALDPDDLDEAHDDDDDGGPTVARDYSEKPKPKPARRSAPPAALAAKIHAPAVSAINKPRPSKRTPQGGVPVQSSVLQKIVGSQGSAPMPTPRPAPVAQPAPAPQPLPQAPPAYATDASGMPLGVPTPPSGVPVAHDPNAYPGYPPQYGYPPPGYPPPQGYPPPGYPPQQGYPPPGYPPPQGYPPPGYPPQQGYAQPPMSPGGLYQFQPAPEKMTLTGQLRLFEVDEIPSQYKLDASRRRWFTSVVAALVAVSLAAGVTFFIIRSTRDAAPTVGSIKVDSVPPGAEVSYDGERLVDKTPMTIGNVPVGTRHEIKVTLAKHKPYTETVDIGKTGGEREVRAALDPVTGKLKINSSPGGADIYINDQLRGRTPTILEDVDMSSAKKLELKLKDFQPHVQSLEWPDNGEIIVDAKLKP
jgi:serine/threonine protein kinase